MTLFREKVLPLHRNREGILFYSDSFSTYAASVAQLVRAHDC